MKEFAIDFETVYTADVSLKKIPTWQYVFHPEAVPYLVAVHNDDFHWVGDPKDFDWSTLHDATLWAHNAHFDGLVFKRLEKDGIIPATVIPRGWKDTADMVSYLRYQRSLDKAVKVALGRDLDKGPRGKAKGLTAIDIKAAGWWNEMVQYGGGDAVACWDLRTKLAPQWPAFEQSVSDRSREACWRGFQLDQELATKYKALLDTFLWQVERDIPWEWDREKTPLSPTEIRKECAKAGISVPSSFAKDSVECNEWEQKHADKFPWVRGIRHWRRANFIRMKLSQLLAGCDESGVYHYDMRYCGADTGRFAAGSGRDRDGAMSNRFSVHGMPKFPIYVHLGDTAFFDGATGQPEGPGWEPIDVRHTIVARPGKKLLVWDLAQIEPRLIHFLTGNADLLALIRERGISVYQAEAETAYGWKGVDLKKEDKALYQFIKTEYLGGQYQCSGKKLQIIAHRAGMELPLNECEKIIRAFREKNYRIPALWARLQRSVGYCCMHHEPYRMVLPSGRVLDYNELHIETAKEEWRSGAVAGQYLKGDTSYRIYGGSLTNNLVQGTGRDVLCYKADQLEQAGYGWPLWTVHDEGINEVDEEMATDEHVARVRGIIEQEIPWLAGMPLGAEVVSSKHYLK